MRSFDDLSLIHNENYDYINHQIRQGRVLAALIAKKININVIDNFYLKIICVSSLVLLNYQLINFFIKKFNLIITGKYLFIISISLFNLTNYSILQRIHFQVELISSTIVFLSASFFLFIISNINFNKNIHIYFFYFVCFFSSFVVTISYSPSLNIFPIFFIFIYLKKINYKNFFRSIIFILFFLLGILLALAIILNFGDKELINNRILDYTLIYNLKKMLFGVYYRSYKCGLLIYFIIIFYLSIFLILKKKITFIQLFILSFCLILLLGNPISLVSGYRYEYRYYHFDNFLLSSAVLYLVSLSEKPKKQNFFAILILIFNSYYLFKQIHSTNEVKLIENKYLELISNELAQTDISKIKKINFLPCYLFNEEIFGVSRNSIRGRLIFEVPWAIKYSFEKEIYEKISKKKYNHHKEKNKICSVEFNDVYFVNQNNTYLIVLY